MPTPASLPQRQVLHCTDCDLPVTLGPQRVLHCMGCGTVPRGTVARIPDEDPLKPRGRIAMLMCCAECDSLLHLTSVHGGAYCSACAFTPSMQDTYFHAFCETCRVPTVTVDGGQRCPNCSATPD